MGLSKKKLSHIYSNRDQVEIEIDLFNHHLINPIYDGGEIPILFEDPSFIVLDKPPFLHCHPLKYTDKDTCLNYFREQGLSEVLAVNFEEYDRGLLHRLDYETSGVLVAAKSQAVYQEVFENRDIIINGKFYLAIVQGSTPEKGYLFHQLGKSEVRGKKIIEKVDGNPCELYFSKVSFNEEHDLSLVLVRLVTGHRHQIRVQFSLSGHPLLGDELYGGKAANRLFLHCYQYDLNFHEKKYSFTSSRGELFERFFDLDTCLEMISDKLRSFDSR